jgi:integration host factor subunit alpha
LAIEPIDLKRFRGLVFLRVEEPDVEAWHEAARLRRSKEGFPANPHGWIGDSGRKHITLAKEVSLSTTGVRMTQKTVTRADLAEAVYGSVGLSRTESAELVERVLELITEALITGANVKLSSFGSFQVRSKNERIGRNPKTGEEVPILPRQVLVFKPSNVLKSKINKSMVAAEK